MLDDRSDSDLPEAPLDETGKAAATWLSRINRGLRPEEVKELRNWLQVARHRPVILDMARLYHGPEIVALLSEVFPAGPEPMQSEVFKELAKAAALTTIVVGLVILAVTGREPWMKIRGDWEARHTTCAKPTRELTTGFRGMYGTAVGGRRELTLPDHSTVTLNTNTCMGVAYSPETRVILLPYGEATFHVVHEKHRPFLVRAGHSRRFEAVGTDFNVRVLSPDHVELTVTEGNVRVLYTQDTVADTPAEARLRDHRIYDDTTVGALQTALVEPGLQFVRNLEASDVHTLLAWQQGLIFFNGTTLEEALAEVDRYTTTQFVLADERLRGVRIGGSFRTGDVDGLLASLRRDFMIESRRDTHGRVVLSALEHLPRS